MTPLPKRRHSTRRGGKRQAAIKIAMPAVTACKNCHSYMIPHRACPNCGQYDGKSVIVKKEKKKSSQ